MKYIRESIGFTPKNFNFFFAQNMLLKKKFHLFGSRPHLGQFSALHTQNFEITVPKGSHLREVFRGFAL
jgi:hypothetical protein